MRQFLDKKKIKKELSMRKFFTAIAVLSTVFVCAQEGEDPSEEVKEVNAIDEHLTCNCPGHDVEGEEEEVDETALLACSKCDKDKK